MTEELVDGLTHKELCELTKKVRVRRKQKQFENQVFGFSFPTVDQVLDELELGGWDVFVLEADQGGDPSLIQGTRIRGDTWTIRHEDWDTEISKEITEYPYHGLMQTICQLQNCLLWASFA